MFKLLRSNFFPDGVDAPNFFAFFLLADIVTTNITVSQLFWICFSLHLAYKWNNLSPSDH